MRDEKNIQARSDPRSYCEGKEPIKSFELAQRIAQRQRSRHDNAGHVYRCARCQAFHIGELVGGRRRRDELPDDDEVYA